MPVMNNTTRHYVLYFRSIAHAIISKAKQIIRSLNKSAAVDPRTTGKKTVLKYLLIWFLISCMAPASLVIFTNDASAAITENEEAVRDIQRKQREIEQKLREKERIEREAKEKEMEKGAPPTEEGGIRFLIKEIIIEHPELLSAGEKNYLLAPFLNKEINYNDINVLTGRITNVLIDKGYITTRVKVPLGQNLKSGKLVLTIINGYIEDVVPEKDGIRNRMQLFSAFPFFEGNLLNINDLDYGIEKMNRLESNNATMKIEPGEALGASRIVIYNTPGFLLHLETGVDNLGQKTTGEYRKKISAGLDNLLSVNDYSLVTYTDGTDTDTRDKFTRCYTLFFEFPLGYWSFSSTYSRSEHMQHVSGLSSEYKISGNDSSGIFSIDRLIWRKKFDRLKGKMSLNLKEKETFIQDIKIDAQSDKLSIMEAGLAYNGFILGGYFYSEACYDRGARFFGATRDTSGMAEDVPRAQFNKYKMNAFWNRPFSLMGQGFAYSISINGQYGMETLYTSEQQSIGDFYTVRGFKNYSAAGDRGYYARNEISVNDFARYWSYLRGLKLFSGFDYGYVIDKIGRSANGGRGEATLAGISAGINYTSPILTFNVTYGMRVTSPDFIKEDRSVIYFTVTANLTNLFGETVSLAKKI